MTVSQSDRFEKVVIGNATLFRGDCMEILPTLGKVDLTFTSPPYNMRTRVRNGEYTERETGAHFSRKYDNFHDALPVGEYYEFHKQTISMMLERSNTVMINWQVVTGSKEAWFRIMGDFCRQIKDVIIWDKGFGEPAMHENIINRGHEQILVMENGAVAGRECSHSQFGRGKMQDIWRISRTKEVIDGHSATFPVGLPSKAIQGWVQDDGVVLDPFMGSGTTGVACMNLDRKFIGIEIDERYFQIACERIERAQQQLKLFGGNDV